MKPFANIFASMFDRDSHDTTASRRRAIHQEWDRQRQNAMSPADRAEIDAIFARSL